MIVARYLHLPNLLKRKSFFLFGPRRTGKSTLIARQLQDQAKVIDLLDSETFFRISTDPSWFEGIVRQSGHKTVVVDEIQRVPELLNSVHKLIEMEGLCLLLTGSSVRKLRRGNANFLAGRAAVAHLFPLIRAEIPAFDLERYLHYGGMPAVYLHKNPEQELTDYVVSYMQEEVQAEGFVRDLSPFSRFLQTMALMNGEIINFTKISSDCHVPARSVKGYVQVLEDTLLGSTLQPWRKSRGRKAVGTAKFYLFDTGVARSLAGVKYIERHSNLYGKSFEHFIWMELRAYLSYTGRSLSALTFWRSKHGTEVDFLVDDELAIEVKAARRTSNRDLKGLKALAEEGVFKNFYLVSHDRSNRKYEDFYLIYWENFLDDLWAGKLLNS